MAHTCTVMKQTGSVRLRRNFGYIHVLQDMHFLDKVTTAQGNEN